jgi:hypothetical protein
MVWNDIGLVLHSGNLKSFKNVDSERNSDGSWYIDIGGLTGKNIILS